MSPHTPLRDEWTGHNRPNYPPEATAQVTAPSWPEVVAAVAHDADCIFSPSARHPACDCVASRDARIGAGIAAALASARLWRGNHGQIDDAAAFAAFREASKPKEG